jgi:RHS repeat-associated protein
MSSKLCAPVAWKRGLRLVGDPVDVVTGAQTFFETDFRLQGEHIPVSWTRHYDSRRPTIDCGIGLGFRLNFGIELRFDLDGMTFVDTEGETIAFPFLEADGERLLRGGYVLERMGQHQYRIHPPDGDSSWEFRFDRDVVARPNALFIENDPRPPLRLQHERGQLTALHLGPGRRVVFEYAGTHLIGAVLLEADGITKQHLVRYRYDDKGHLVEAQDAYGGVLRYEYDQSHRLTRFTDRRGYSFLHSYDDEGRCVHTRGEDGVEEYRFEYKPLERLTVVTRGDGAVTSYYYDENDAIIQVIDACGGLTAYLKDDSGRVVAELDPNGNKSEILYDDRGQPYAKRDPLGHIRLLPADPTPHPLSHRLPESPVQWEHGDWPGPVQAPPEDVPLEKWLPRWVVETWGDNPTAALPPPKLLTNVQGLPVREERLIKRGGPPNQAGKPTIVRRWAYDFNGYFRWYTDFDGKTSRYEYGSWNHLQREIDPKGSVTEYGYTKSERVAFIVDPQGTRHDYGYDKKDRLVEVRRHGKVRESYQYDAADNLIAKVDGQGNPLLSFTIAPGNLLKQRTLASGDVQDFEYTKDGRLAAMKNRAGTTTFEYNLDGRRIADERDGKGVRHRFVADRISETTVFGELTTRYIHTNATTTIVIDPAGQTQRLRIAGPGLIERSCSNDIEELSQYDVAGRCLLKAAEGGRMQAGWARRFEYSGEGDLLRRDDTLRGTVRFEHDDAHRLSKVQFANGSTQEYEYDRAGNLLRGPDLSTRMQTGNRLLEANGSRFAYNERDHISGRKNGAGETRYKYDSRDLLVAIEGPGVSYRAVHDGLGRRTQKTVNGQTWHYYWDSDRLAAEIFPNGRLRIYVYPDAFALVPLLFLEYDNLDPASGKRYHIYTDHLGCPELVLDDNGRTVWRAYIDPYGNARVDVGQDFHQPLRWPGHYYDSETGLHDNRFRTYSPELGRYLQCDPAGTEGGLNLYAYTDNPLRAVDLRGNEQTCPEGTKDCPFKKEGGHDAELAAKAADLGVSTKTLRTAASTQTGGNAQRARRQVITAFLRKHGQEWDGKGYSKPTDAQIRNHLRGHDLTKPVTVGPPPSLKGPQYQWQHPDNKNRGAYYTGDKDTQPTNLGTSPVANTKDKPDVVPKQQKTYEADDKKESPPYVESTSKPIADNWSVKDHSQPGSPAVAQPTEGGGTQRLVPDRTAFKDPSTSTS